MLTAAQIIDLPLKLVGGQRSQSLETINNVIVALTMKLKMRHTFVLECPPYNSIRDKFPSLFENVLNNRESQVFLPAELLC